MSILEEFLTEVEGFLAEAPMEPTAFGRLALSDPNFVFQLRSGRSPQANTIDKVREFMAQHRAGQAA